MSINITVEGRDRDEWQLAAKMLKIIEEAQPSVKERLGIGSSKTKKRKDFHSQLVDEITKKLIDYYYPDRYTPSEKILWGVSLTFPGGSKNVKLRRFIENILQFEEEAADEIFGDE